MDIIRFSIERPVSVAVGVILVVMFGLISFGAIPIQLTPTVDHPIITVTTNWPGRAPEEIVDEIVKEQEERLKNVTNLRSMRSASSQGSGVITLEFNVGADIDRARQEVSDSLREVPEYPDDVDEPFITVAEGAAENAIAWIIVDLDPAHAAEHPNYDITTLYQPLDKLVKPMLERIPGVAQVNIFGGRERELRVYVKPRELAARRLTHMDVINALRSENRNVSAGTIAEGKRDIRVRLLGQFDSLYEVLESVVDYRDGKPVFIQDVADVSLEHQKRRGFVRSFGSPSLAINIIRQSDANVMSIMSAVRDELDLIRTDVLPTLDDEVRGHLRLRQVYDETTYITSAIDLVTQNLWVGGGIAVLVLLLFLRSFISTGVIALAIPVSVIGTFLVLVALGRTLNVISLAGLAFAVGMVVDNAIVVLENIHRRLHEGDDPKEAAYKGGKEVWGAVFASTLTTVAVFIPVLTIQEEAGQLFRDIALAIVAAVTLSLVVSVLVIPAACSRWMRRAKKVRTSRGGPGAVIARGVRLVNTGWRGWTVRPLLIVGLTAISLLGAAWFAPPLDYLPAGNRNLVFGGMLIPPGLSVDEQRDYAERIETIIKPYADLPDEEVAELPPIARFGPFQPFDPVGIDNFFIGSFGGTMFVGATSRDERVVIPIGALLTGAMMGLPDTYGGARQASIFGRGVAGSSNSINVEISGPDLDRVTAAASMLFGNAMQRYPGNVSSEPGNFNLTQPEWTLRVNHRGRELGLTTGALAEAVRGLFDGAFVDDFRLSDENVDMVVLPEGGRLPYKEKLAEIPITTPAGATVPLDSVVDATITPSPQTILRIEELPAVSIQIVPPTGEPIETLMDEIEAELIEPMRQAGLLDSTMFVRLEGTAAKLDEVNESLFGASTTPEEHGKGRRLKTAGRVVAGVLVVACAALAIVGLVRGVRGRHAPYLYGAVGYVILGVIGAMLLLTVASSPQLLTARAVWALMVTYLLMCALFEDFLYPFVIMFTVPLAVVGGFLGLSIVHGATMRNPLIAPQQLDVLTMLGFIILVGVVVNNAILIVHQALNLIREGLEREDAIAESVRTRVRPIFMSTMTSVGGMLPLVLFPGAGSEMYRGLGSVVIGGLLLATVFTLVLVPILLSLIMQMREGAVAVRRFRSSDAT